MVGFLEILESVEKEDGKTTFSLTKPDAEKGDAKSQMLLGVCYATGRGVPQHYVFAHMWFNLAAAKGNETGKDLREIIAKDMTPEQIAEAQGLAVKWFEKTPADLSM